MYYFSFMALLLALGCSSTNKTAPVENRNAILTDAYEFGFPIILMEMTRRGAPMNQFTHLTQFPTAESKYVVRPNVDTLYSSGWVDLTEGPVVLELPNTNGRYYLMQLMDAWTNVYSSLGKRTTGTQEHKFLIVGPTWKGTLPKNMNVIHSPTTISWILGRTQTNSVYDGKTTVAKIQQGYKLYPLLPYDVISTPTKKESNKTAVDEVFSMSARDFFAHLGKLMGKNPPNPKDKSMLKKLASIGVRPGKGFSFTAMNPEEDIVFNRLPIDLRNKLEKRKADTSDTVNGWSLVHGAGKFGTNYSLRAYVAYVGLGANLEEDAVYPTAILDGHEKKLNGHTNYVLHFNKNQIPQTLAFWSLTVYGSDNYLVKNSINRYALGSRDDLKYNSDGSLDIYLQPTSPGKRKESNWLPTPQGDFDVTARIYWPGPEVKKSGWKMPPILSSPKKDISQNP